MYYVVQKQSNNQTIYTVKHKKTTVGTEIIVLQHRRPKLALFSG